MKGTNHRQSRGYLYRHIAGRRNRTLMKKYSARDVAIHNPIVTLLWDRRWALLSLRNYDEQHLSCPSLNNIQNSEERFSARVRIVSVKWTNVEVTRTTQTGSGVFLMKLTKWVVSLIHDSCFLTDRLWKRVSKTGDAFCWATATTIGRPTGVFLCVLVSV